MKLIRYYFGLCMVLLLSCAGCNGIDESPDGGTDDKVHVGDKIPMFKIALSTGDSISSDGLKGKSSVVVLFHTSCKDCQREFPTLEALYKKYGESVNFLCIGREQDATVAAAYWSENSMTLPYSPQPDRNVYHLFAERTIPRVYVADKEGIIVAAFKEKVDASQLEQAITGQP